LVVLLLAVFLDPFEGDGAGSFDGETESSSPEQVGHATEGSGDSEDDGVVVEFGHTVMVQQDTGVGINIGPGVLDFTEVLKDGGNDIVDSLAEFDEGIVLDVFNGEFSLMDISGVSVSEDGVTITGNDLSGTEGSLGEFLDLFSGDVVTEFSLQVQQPSQDFLIGETVEGTSETVKGSGVREIRISQSGTDQVASMGRDVTTFVIRVDGQITSNAFLDFVLLITQLVSEVTSPIEVGVRSNNITTFVEMSVDQSGDSGDLGDQVHGIFVDGIPVLGLVDTLSVSLGEFRVGLEVEDGSRQLSHGVHVVGEVLNEFFSFVGDSSSGLEFFRDGLELSLSGEFTGHQEPQETFGEGFTTVGGLGKVLAQVRDGVSSELYTFNGVEEGSIPDHGHHVSHTTEGLINGDGTDMVLSVLFLNFLKFSLLLGDDFLKLSLESAAGEGIVVNRNASVDSSSETLREHTKDSKKLYDY
jgi:hypothetical protein